MEHPRLDLRQLARRGELSTALNSSQPRTEEQAAALNMLAMLLPDDLCRVLTRMIRTAIETACLPLRELIAEVVELLTDADPVRDPERRVVGYRLAIAADLARRLARAASEGIRSE
jgi:hypothetical protein